MINVVAAFITKSHKFLIAQRANGKLKGKWEFPGGKIELNESDFDAVEREILEELNLCVEATALIAKFKHKYPFAIINLKLINCNIRDNSRIDLKGSHENFEWIDYSANVDFAPLDKKVFNYLEKNIVL